MTTPGKKYDASIIIPSFGQKEYISTVLESLSQQETEFDYEIIVVESSNDGTAELVRNEFPEVKVIELERRAYPGTARNVGIEIAQSEVLLFTDTDCVADNRWVQRMVEGQCHGKKALAGVVLNGTPRHLIGIADYLLEFYEQLGKKSGLGKIAATCNVSYHRSLFDRLGLFKDQIKGSDGLFAREVLSKVEPINFDPKIKIWHRNRTSLIKLVTNQYQLGRGAALSRSKYRISGRVFLKYQILIPLMPILRSLKIAYKLLVNNFIDFIRFLLVYPLILTGLIAHAYGFFIGVRCISK